MTPTFRPFTRSLIHPFALLLAVLTCLTALTPAHAAAALPQGLSANDWGGIRAAYEANRHHVFATKDGGYAARNPGQQWQTCFDGRGFVVQPDKAAWRWGLEVRRYGFAGHERTIAGRPAMRSDGSRLSYAWDHTLQEWFVNDQRGLEHGFTLHQRPASSTSAAHSGAPLTVTLAVRGDLRPQVAADGRGVSFVDARGVAALNYTQLHVYDADGRTLPAHFEAADAAGRDGTRQLRLAVQESGARYPLTIDPIAQQAYIKASNTGAGDFFGVVAISGDTVVVGAQGESSDSTGVNGSQINSGATQSGAVYIFVRDGITWSQQAYIKASNTNQGDQFGTSVAIDGDTVVVGSAREASNANGVNGLQSDNSLPESGAAYVFTRSGTTWSQQAYIKASNPDAYDHFGSLVAVSGDTIVVGAPFESSNSTGINSGQMDNSAVEAGAAYVFVRSSGNWSQQAYLKASNAEAGDEFGFVAISGNTIAVGAIGEASSSNGVGGLQNDNSAFASGAAYIFVRDNSGIWSQQAYLKASNPDTYDEFGTSVAISGNTVVVGAPYEASSSHGVDGLQIDNSATQSGAAYVFVRDGTTWSQQTYLKASNPDAYDRFGRAVAISGGTVVVGAFLESSSSNGVNGVQTDNSLTAAGAAYVFVRGGTTWSQQTYLKASNPGASDNFGLLVAISGGTAVVGALFEASSSTGIDGVQTDNSAVNAGAAYIFTGLGAANDPPVATNQNLTTNEDTAKAITLTATDANNDALTYSIVSNPTHGTLSGTALNLTYTPSANYNGSDSFTFKANDGTADSNVATITLQVLAVNDAPSFTIGANQTVPEDSGLQVLAGFITNISPGPANENGQTLAFTVTNDNNALFAAQPSIAPNGTLSYTPAANANGVANVRVILQDDGSTANGGVNTSAPQMFTITIGATNDAPFVDLNGNAAGTDFSASFTEDGGAVSIVDSSALTVSDIDSANLASAIITLNNRPDGDSEILAATPSGAIAAGNMVYANGVLTITANAPLADYQAVLRSVTYNNLSQNPNSAARSVSFLVNDGALNSNVAISTVQVLAVNDAPIAQSQNLSADNATPLSITLSATDADNDALSFTIVSGPNNGTLSGTAPNLIYTATPGFRGSDAFTFTASDGTATATASVTISVGGAPSVTAGDDNYNLILGPPNQAQQSGVVLLSSGVFQIQAPGVLRNDSFAADSALTVRAISNPKNGRFQLRNDGTLFYLPSTGLIGLDEFTYALTDGKTTATARVRVNVIDRRAPELAFDTPRDRQTVASLTKIAGRVRDRNAGLKTVTLLWQRFDGKFWNGSAWTSGATELPLNVQGINWIYNGPLPKIGTNAATELLDGRYDLRVSATDKSNNISRITNRITVVTAPAVPEFSTVRLSSSVASAAQDTIVLNFTGALNAEAAANVANYQVLLGDGSVKIGSAAYRQNAVTLSGFDFAAGDAIQLQISGLRDAAGKVLKDGAINLVVR